MCFSILAEFQFISSVFESNQPEKKTPSPETLHPVFRGPKEPPSRAEPQSSGTSYFSRVPGPELSPISREIDHPNRSKSLPPISQPSHGQCSHRNGLFSCQALKFRLLFLFSCLVRKNVDDVDIECYAKMLSREFTLDIQSYLLRRCFRYILEIQMHSQQVFGCLGLNAILEFRVVIISYQLYFQVK